VEEEPVEIPITDARAQGFRQVRLIHGRGIGMQRANVQTLLRRLEWVEQFWDDASLGATVVVLRTENVDAF
jgi:dsDNA-specific endonuclease/ATPase MutS2